MDDYPIGFQNTPLELLFPSLKPEERAEMRDLLDDYCEIAWQVWERLESEHVTNGALKESGDASTAP